MVLVLLESVLVSSELKRQDRMVLFWNVRTDGLNKIRCYSAKLISTMVTNEGRWSLSSQMAPRKVYDGIQLILSTNMEESQ